MIRLTTILVCLSLLAWPQTVRAYSGSDAQQKACTSDVFRLCLKEIPDENRIVACLMAKRALLSPSCAEVFLDPPRQVRRQP